MKQIRFKNKSIFTEAGLQKNSEILIRGQDFIHRFQSSFYCSFYLLFLLIISFLNMVLQSKKTTTALCQIQFSYILLDAYWVLGVVLGTDGINLSKIESFS